MIESLKAVASAILMIGAASLAGQAYGQTPTDNRPIRLIVGYAPGGITDSLARVIAEALRVQIGRTVTVDNRPGAAGNISAGVVAKSPADGTVIYFGAVGLTTTPAVSPSAVQADPVEGLTPVGLIAYTPNVLIVRPDYDLQTVPDVIKSSKAGREFTYASSGTGGGLHLTGEIFAVLTGIKMTHVPYRGSAPALVDLLGGRLDMQIDNVSGSLQLIEEGKVRALAVTSPNRMKELPNVPTMTELGFRGMEVGGWFGLFYPPGASSQMVSQLSNHLNAVLDTDSVKKYIRNVGLTPLKSDSPAQFKDYLRNDITLWAQIVKSTGIKIDPQ